MVETQKVFFSVVMAVHNEAENIGKCLRSINTLADEIIVVDGESSDETVAIAENMGARVITTTNKPNFHINKQIAMDAALGTLVLQLDADEVVDDELYAWLKNKIGELQTYKDSNLTNLQPKAWYLKRKNFFLNHFLSKGGQYPDPVIRLYINRYAKLPQQNVHEQMVIDGQVATASGHLLHYSNPSFDNYLTKWNRYTTFEAHRLAEKNLPIHFQTVISYLVLKPFVTFFSLYVRHKGFMDGIAGFVFAVMSSVFHMMTFLKLWEHYERQCTV